MPYQIRCFTARVTRNLILPSIFLVALASYSSAFCGESIQANGESPPSGKYSARQVSKTEQNKTLPLEEKWDAPLSGSNITLTVKIKEYRIYKLSIRFEYADGQRADKELKRVTGDGSMQLVTKESADTDRPVVVPQFSKEEQDFLKSGGALVSGSYFTNHPLGKNQRLHTPPADSVWRLSPAGAGVTIPVHIQVEQIETTGPASVLSDKIINTRGIEAHSPDGLSLFRLITQLELRPGNYRLHVRAMQTTPMPQNVQTFIDATWDPRIGPLKESE